MKKAKILIRQIILGVTLGFIGLLAVNAQTPVKVTENRQREAFEKIIRDYLLEHPEVIQEAMQALQLKEQKKREASISENIKKFSARIYTDASSPIIGNTAGDVSIVVFYDYFCGYCKKTLPELQRIIASDKSVKIIFKELPIMGPQSMSAAKAALAAGRQGKFEAFHLAMLESNSGSDEAIKAISEQLGIDYAKLQKDMQDPDIDAAINGNLELATYLNINGTPAYLVGNQFIPGAVDANTLTKLIESERQKNIAANPKKDSAQNGKAGQKR